MDQKAITIDGVTTQDICEQCNLNLFDCTCKTEFGGYANDIITNPNDYDALEVHGVRSIKDRDGTEYCEVDDDSPEFFSVYAHLKEGGVECIGDFETKDHASTYAERIATLYAWPIQ